MFGDILSDEAAALAGRWNAAERESRGGEREQFFGLSNRLEEQRGHAAGFANPIAQVLSAALMLQYIFNLREAHDPNC